MSRISQKSRMQVKAGAGREASSDLQSFDRWIFRSRFRWWDRSYGKRKWIQLVPRTRAFKYTEIQTHCCGLRREPGERDAGRAQLREAAAGSGHGPKVKAPSESYRPHTAPYIRHFNLFKRHMSCRARERGRGKETHN